MTTLAAIFLFAIALFAGFMTGINFRGNPPKRTRKRKNQTAPEGQPENK